jgi:hypothetical protein
VSGRSWERTDRQNNDWRVPLPGDGTVPKALPLRQGFISQDHQPEISEPIASRSISDRCQILDDTFVCRCSGSLPPRIFFAPEQTLSRLPNNPVPRPEVQCALRRRGLGRHADRWITLDLPMEIPAGTTLVEGPSAQDVPHGRAARCGSSQSGPHAAGRRKRQMPKASNESPPPGP